MASSSDMRGGTPSTEKLFLSSLSKEMKKQQL